MIQDTIIKNAVEYINELFGDNSDGHDALHTLSGIQEYEANCAVIS